MKKFIYLVLLSLSALLTSPVFAYISGKIALNEKRIYCPDQIICSQGGDLLSCKYTSDNPPYWGDLQVPFGGPVKGTYEFWKVSSGYHSGGGSVMCFYKQKETSQEIYLFAKKESNLEAYYDKSTNWNISFGAGACESASVSLCPLKESSIIQVILNKNELNSIQELNFSVNSIPLSGSSLGNFDKIQYYFTYENVSACWSDKQCKIDIEIYGDDLGHILVGSVIFDMDNKLKVLNIIPNQASKMDIQKIEPFNAIEIKKSDAPPYPTLEIDNLIRSEVSVSINDVDITKIGSHGNLFSYRVKDVCTNLKECKIDLKAGFGENKGLIGSVVVDIENSMNILSVQSTRSSEITINKINYHKIEVSYPNF